MREDTGNKYWIAGLSFTPRFGFDIQNFGADATLTEANEVHGNLSSEAYAQLGLPETVFLYFDARGGGQFLQRSFAQAAGLGGSTAFAFAQIGFGIQISGILRVGGESGSWPRKGL